MPKMNESKEIRPCSFSPHRLAGKLISLIFRNVVSIHQAHQNRASQIMDVLFPFYFTVIIYSTTPFEKYQFHLWYDCNGRVPSECYLGYTNVLSRLLQCVTQYAFRGGYCIEKCVWRMFYFVLFCFLSILWKFSANFSLWKPHTHTHLDGKCGLFWPSQYFRYTLWHTDTSILTGWIDRWWSGCYHKRSSFEFFLYCNHLHST